MLILQIAAEGGQLMCLEAENVANVSKALVLTRRTSQSSARILNPLALSGRILQKARLGREGK